MGVDGDDGGDGVWAVYWGCSVVAGWVSCCVCGGDCVDWG